MMFVEGKNFDAKFDLEVLVDYSCNGLAYGDLQMYGDMEIFDSLR